MLWFFFVLLVLPVAFVKKRGDGEAVFDKVETTCLKGVLCLFVMFHNLGLDYYKTDGIFRLIAEHAGGVGVGLFFFLSAFGIMRSYEKYGNAFLKKLLLEHIPRLYVLSVFINALTYFVFFKGHFETGDALMRIFELDLFNGFNRMNRHGWYIASIIALYLVFALVCFVCSKLKTEKRTLIAVIIMAVIPVALRVAAIAFDTGGMYTREIHGFTTGIVYAAFYERINAFFKRYFLPALIVTGIMTVVGFFFYEPLSTHAAALFLIAFAQKFTCKSKICHLLGKACLGVYLYLHFSTLVLSPYVGDPYLWTLLNAGFILELSFITYGVQRALSIILNAATKFIKRKQGEENS